MPAATLAPDLSANRPRTHPRWRASLRVTPLLPTTTDWQTINVSEGGVFVQAKDLLPPGSMLDLGLWLAAERITGKAEVVWINDPSRPGSNPNLPLGMGLRFLGLGQRDRHVYLRYLRDLERRVAPGVHVHPKPRPTDSGPPWVASADVVVDAGLAEGHVPAEELPEVLPAGTVLGSYRVIRRLGCGGMGDVYVAEHTELGRRVAVKRLHARFAADRQIVARFLGEARVVNQICHPNIVEITDFCGTGEQPYFVMELLTGQTLEEALTSEGALPLSRFLRIGQQLSAVLDVVHHKGVVHRDLKPQNIFLIERNGQPDFVKLLDFGIAKHANPLAAVAGLRTADGIVLGTPGYMAPEQLDGKPVDFKSDIYAFGIVLYQMATGRAPFLADTWGKMVLQQVTQKPPRPSDITGAPLLPALEELILGCLAKNPKNRPASMAAIHTTLEELRAALADSRLTSPRIVVESPLRPAGFSRRLAATLGLAAALLTGLAWGLISGSSALGRRPEATVEPRSAEAALAAAAPAPAILGPALVVRPLPEESAGDVSGGAGAAKESDPAHTAVARASRHRARAGTTSRGAREPVRSVGSGEPAGAAARAASATAATVREHYERGLKLMRERKPFLAVDELEQAIALDATYAPAYRALGSVYGLVGREQKMVESWRRYLALAPDGPDAAKIELILEKVTSGQQSSQ